MTAPAAALAAPPSAFDALRYWASVDPDRLALVERPDGRRWSYGELDALAEGWVRWLRARGIGPRDRVGLLARNGASHVALLYACLRSASVLVPFNWRLAGIELARCVADCDPSVLLAHRDFAPLLASAAVSRDRWIDLDQAPTASPSARGRTDLAAHPRAEEDPWLLLYTSGSTGAARGVVLSVGQQFWNAVATAVGWGLSSRDRALVATPLFHTAGWNVFATPLWHSGGAIVLLESFDAGEWLRALREEACTHAFGVPALYQQVVQHPDWGRPLPALRHLVCGGAPCPPALHREAHAAGYRFRNAYGLTECGPNCFATTDAVAAADPQSVGWPLPFLQARIVDEGGADVPAGAPGELWLRGPQLFAGYFGDPEATAAAFAPGGWLRTGDLARRDARGNHTIVGRRGEMYIAGGANVFPGEVEAALLECPAVADAAVVGVPDERWGEAGVAFVVLRAAGAATADEVRDFARTQLAGYKVPRLVVLTAAIPRLGSGKPDRSALARAAAGHDRAASAETPLRDAAY